MKDFGKACALTCLVAGFSISLGLVGCDKDLNDPSIVAYNQNVISGDGDPVGKLKDGRKVTRYALSSGKTGSQQYHYLYVVDGMESISINRTEVQGKSSVDQVEVYIGGTRYIKADSPIKAIE